LISSTKALLCTFQVEHYNNLTLKSIHTLKLLLLLYPKSTKFLVKIDDDSFLNLPRIANVLMNASLDESSLQMFGILAEKSVAFYPKDEKEKQEKYLRKWKTATYMYNQTYNPKHMSGSCYIMTYPAAQCLLKKSMDILYYHMEDVFVTGFAANACNITKVNLEG
jgi:hypothetical protein